MAEHVLIIASAYLWLEGVKSSIHDWAPERRDDDAGEDGEARDCGGEPGDDGRGNAQRSLGAQGLRDFRVRVWG